MKNPWLKLAFASALLALPVAAHAKCDHCGTVVELKTIKRQGEGTGAGAVIGGIAGGVLGHQIGSGRGRDVATVAGAAGGAYVGHQVEKDQRSTTQYQVVVQMDAGPTRFFTFAQPTAYKVGDKVKIVNKKLVRD
jgi:uncharacterized protein YcfJ